MRKGQFGLRNMINLGAILLVMLVVMTFLGDFISPVLQDLVGFFGEAPTNEGVAVGSTRAMVFASSCTAIANAHGQQGSETYDLFRSDWNTPFDEQNFGSDIPFACNASTMPDEPVPGDDETRGAGVVFQGNVTVICDDFDAQRSRCDIHGFTLPERVPFSGLNIFDHPLAQVMFPTPNPMKIPTYLKKRLAMQGAPNYVLYYQKIPKRAEAGWLKRTQNLNMFAIATSAGLNIALAGLEVGGGRIASKVTDMYSVGRSAAGDLLSDMKSRMPVNFAGRGITDTEVALQMAKGSYSNAATRSWVRGTAERSLGGTVLFGKGIYYMGRGITKASYKLVKESYNRGLISGSAVTSRWAVSSTIGFTGTAILRHAPGLIDDNIIAETAGQTFFSDVGDIFAMRMARRFDGLYDDMTIGESGSITFQNVDDSVKIDEIREAAAEEYSYSVRAAMELNNIDGTAADTLLGAIDEAGGYAHFGEKFGTQYAHILDASDNMVARNARQSPALARAMDPHDAVKYTIMSRKQVSNLADKLTRAIDAGSSKFDNFVQKQSMRVQTMYDIGASTRTGKMALYYRDVAEEGSGRLWDEYGSEIYQRFDDRIGTPAWRIIRGGQAAVCSSNMLQAAVLEKIGEEMAPRDQQFWAQVGRCVGFSGNVNKLCRRAGVSRVASDIGTVGTKSCAALTFLGYSADRTVSDMLGSMPGNTNSLYLKTPFSGSMQFKLHPVANYYFMGLSRGPGQPKERFFLASPVYTEGVCGAGHCSDPVNMKLEVKPGIFNHGMVSDAFSDPFNDEGDPQNSAGERSIKQPVWNNDAWDIVTSSIRSLMSFTQEAIGATLSSVPVVSAAVDQRCVESNTGSLDTVPVDVAEECGKRGSFYLNFDRSDTADEILYTNTPQVRKVPGSPYPVIPGQSFGGGSMAWAALYNTTNPDADSAVQRLIPKGTYSTQVGGADGMKVEKISFRTGQNSGCFVVLCESKSIVSPIADDGTINEACEKVSSGQTYGDDDEKHVEKAGMICEDPDQSTSDQGVIGNNVFPMSSLDPTIRGPVKQLWYWAGNCRNGGCRVGMKYRSQMVDNVPLEPVHSSNFENPNELEAMFPTLGPGQTGVVQYQDSTVLSGWLSSAFETLDMTSMTKHKSLRTLIVNFENEPRGGNWVLAEGGTNGNRYAVYGYNADIQANEYAKAFVEVATIAAELYLTAQTGGGYALMMASGASGALTSTFSQMVSIQTAWPNH